jgi:hypothetical protein
VNEKDLKKVQKLANFNELSNNAGRVGENNQGTGFSISKFSKIYVAYLASFDRFASL